MRNRQQYSRALAFAAASLGGMTLTNANAQQAEEAGVVEEVVVTENLPFAFESDSRRILLGVRGTFGGASR